MGRRTAALALGWSLAACGTASPARDAPASVPDAPPVDAGVAAADAPASLAPTLDGNRERLLAGYLARLQAMPGVVQSNGLDGEALPDVCALWAALDPSSRATFLTITHRLEGAALAADGSRALDHITLLYRVNGGQGATASDPGSCGGGEYNRLIMRMDRTLQATLLAAFGGAAALHDLPPHGDWRASQDLGGPHAPFDTSDETNAGAPRGQIQYFADPTSAAANSALGRSDLETVVDPYALEMDEDYDCVHSSNPLCSYVFYGPACLPEASAIGVDVYTESYGDFEAAWAPSGC